MPERPGLAPLLSLLRDRVAGLEAVYLFGSAATETEHNASDLDLAFLAPRPLDPVDRFDVQEAMAVAARRNVDLVDLRAASTVMQAEALRTGRLVLDTDATARAFFEMRTLSAYALLNEERSEIIKAVRERGQVYG